MRARADVAPSYIAGSDEGRDSFTRDGAVVGRVRGADAPAANSPAFDGFVTHSVTKRSNASLVG
jgi:hypothetical protein